MPRDYLPGDHLPAPPGGPGAQRPGGRRGAVGAGHDQRRQVVLAQVQAGGEAEAAGDRHRRGHRGDDPASRVDSERNRHNRPGELKDLKSVVFDPEGSGEPPSCTSWRLIG